MDSEIIDSTGIPSNHRINMDLKIIESTGVSQNHRMIMDPEIIKSTIKGNLPNESPTGSKTLSYQEWLKLPAKEMKARRKEVKD